MHQSWRRHSGREVPAQTPVSDVIGGSAGTCPCPCAPLVALQAREPRRDRREAPPLRSVPSCRGQLVLQGHTCTEPALFYRQIVHERHKYAGARTTSRRFGKMAVTGGTNAAARKTAVVVCDTRHNAQPTQERTHRAEYLSAIGTVPLNNRQVTSNHQ